MDNNGNTTNNDSNGFNQGTQQAPYGDTQYSQNQQAYGQQQYNQQQYNQPNYNQSYGQPPVYQPNIEDQSPLSVGQWMLTILVLNLGCIGLIMAFVWAFGQGNVHRKNFCRGWLIWEAIALVLVIIFVIIFVATGLSMSDVFESSSYTYY